MKSESILAIIGICIAVAAVGVTAWMAVETRRMAGAAKKTFELEQMPILGLRDLRIEPAGTARVYPRRNGTVQCRACARKI